MDEESYSKYYISYVFLAHGGLPGYGCCDVTIKKLNWEHLMTVKNDLIVKEQVKEVVLLSITRLES